MPGSLDPQYMELMKRLAEAFETPEQRAEREAQEKHRQELLDKLTNRRHELVAEIEAAQGNPSVPMVSITTDEYERLKKHNETLSGAIDQLENIICGLVLEQNTERVTINRLAMVRAPGFTPRIKNYVKSIEVTVINNSVLKAETLKPDSASE